MGHYKTVITLECRISPVREIETIPVHYHLPKYEARHKFYTEDYPKFKATFMEVQIVKTEEIYVMNLFEVLWKYLKGKFKK